MSPLRMRRRIVSGLRLTRFATVTRGSMSFTGLLLSLADVLSHVGRELAVLREPLLAGLVPEIGQLVDRGARGEPLHDRPTLGARRWVTVLHRLGPHRALGLLANLVQVDDLAVDGLLSLVD